MNITRLLILADIPPSESPVFDAGSATPVVVLALAVGVGVVVAMLLRRRRRGPH